MIAQIFELRHPDGDVRLSTLDSGVWTDPEGRTWTGAGKVLSAEERGPSASDNGGSISITLSGASPELLSIALDGRLVRAELWIATVRIDDNGARVGQPYDAWLGLCERPKVVGDPKSPSINVTAQSFLMDLATAFPTPLSDAAVREIDPDDTGGSFVNDLVDREIDID